MKRYLFVLVLINCFFFSGFTFTQVLGGDFVISDAQRALLETLPPDQREGILEKMRQADGLKKDLEDTFEEAVNIVDRPERKILTPDEQEEYLRKSRNWVYGFEQFQSSPTTFAPISNIPVPADFQVGPGDKIKVMYWGNKNESKTTTVTRSGVLNLPLLGPITIAGLTFSEAQKLVESKVRSELIGTNVTLSLDQLRSITVYVLGEAYSPGSFTVSALSTLTNVLFVSGGVSETGSVRNIQVKRGGKTVHVFDLYQLLLKGDTNSDVRLQDGDVVFIPLIYKTARAEGFFRRPHLFEIKDGDSVEDLINYAGGFSSAVTKDAKLELSTINGVEKRRDLETFFFNQADKLLKELKDGDSLKVFEHASLEESSISIAGEVEFPGTYTVQKGDRILDIIQRAGGVSDQGYTLGSIFTIKRIAEEQKASFEKSADLLELAIADAITGGNIGNITGDALRPISALISRLRNTNPIGRLILEVDPLTLRSDPFKNILLENGDYLYIPKRPSSVNIVGEVYSPSSHTFDSDVSIANYIKKAGGLRGTADNSNMYVILPNGETIPLGSARRIFSSQRKFNLVPGSTIVIPRNPRPFDWLVLTRSVAPIFADLATSAAAIAAISRD